MSRGTLYTSAECPGGHCTLVQNVQGDILHGGGGGGGTIHLPTAALPSYPDVLTLAFFFGIFKWIKNIHVITHRKYLTYLR